MASLTVGGALLSGFLNVLFDRLASKEVLDFFQGKKLISKLLNELEIKLLSANVLLNDAEEKQLRDPNVKKWLDELKEVVYKADHLMDKINTEALRVKLEDGESRSKASKLFNFVPKLFSPFDNAIKSEIEEILGTLEHLLRQTDLLGLNRVDKKTPSYRSYAPLVEENEVFGREADKEAIVKLLLSDDVGGHKIAVIPIVGMGGIGKTTLAQHVYKDNSVQEHFNLKAWVTVSEDFDVFRITKIIFEQITSGKCQTEELHQLQNDLKNSLKGKKFIFVLDDIWTENYDMWDLLKSFSESGACGSKIIVTTRNESVALKLGNVQPYNLQLISDDGCWKLFAKHVSIIGSEEPSDFQEIGKQIVKKCKGLPLAVKSMAGLLRSTSSLEEWKWVLQSNMWELQNNNITPALWLSYQFLPPHLKRCFSYFSIFPKDYEFYKEEREKIILMWMAEGLLQPQKGKRLEDVGEDYLNALISRSFFQQRSGWHGLTLSMHDLMHDLAMYVSGESCFIYGSYNNLHNITSKTHHLSYFKDFKGKIELKDLSKAKYLRSLLALPLSHTCQYSESRLNQEVLHELLPRAGGCLRALSLFGCFVTKLPDSIGNLKHLRYLDISHTKIKELPISVCTLYNLETMLLLGCKRLTQLPTNISKLINLRHLVIRDTSLKEMPPKICDMKNLQTLSNFVLCENAGSRIKELRELQFLEGSLCISGLENVKDARDALEGNLKNKKYLNELILRWKGEADDSTKEREVLNALQPHINVKKLKITGYKGTKLPDWVLHLWCYNFAEVSLSGFSNCCLVPQIDRLDGFLDIHDDFRGTSLNKPFQFLEVLELSEINIWDWSFINTGDQEGMIFPCLKRFTLRSCPKLNVGLPIGSFPSLEVISIFYCSELVVVFPTSPHLDAAYPSLEKLEIYFCSRLESFSKMGLPSSLESLYITNSNMILANRMTWNLQRLSSFKHLTVWGPNYSGGGYEEVMDSFPEEWLLPTSLRHLYISGFENLKALNGKGFQHLTSLQELTLVSLDKLECLPAEGLPQTLTYLCISDCPLVSPRCGREDWPKIQHIPHIYILDNCSLGSRWSLRGRAEDWPKIQHNPQVKKYWKEI